MLLLSVNKLVLKAPLLTFLCIELKKHSLQCSAKVAKNLYKTTINELRNIKKIHVSGAIVGPNNR